MAKRKVIGTCKICFENKELSKGHIVPRWSSNLEGFAHQYHRHTDNKPVDSVMIDVFERKLLELEIDDSSGLPKDCIGLPTEYLFCETCDGELGKGEHLLREIVHPSANKSNCISEMNNSTIAINGEKYVKQFYLALGGLLLKAAIANIGGFENITFLGEENRQILLNAMKNGTLSRHITVGINKIYSFENFAPSHATDTERILFGLFTPFDFQFTFEAEYKDGTIQMVFIFGGLMIDIHFTPEEVIDPDNSSLDFIELEILPIDLRYFLYEKTTVFGQHHPSDDELRELREKMREIPLKSECPCKVPYTHNGIKINRDFENCCYKYWGFDKI